MVNLKTELTRKQGPPNFSKNEYLLPPDTHTYRIDRVIERDQQHEKGYPANT